MQYPVMMIVTKILVPVIGLLIEGMHIIPQTKIQTTIQTILNKVGINIDL